MKIGLAGASFDTGNYGVNALAEASIKCLSTRWPDAEFVFLACARSRQNCEIKIGAKRHKIGNLPIRFCRNIFLKNHYVVLFAAGLFLRMFASKRLVNWTAKHNSFVDEILSLDRVADITGGDSFTDLYGLRRFIQGGLIKLLWIVYGKPLYFLPQTYGPFKNRWVKRAARYMLSKSAAILCRDKDSVDVVTRMFATNTQVLRKITYVPDVGFMLDAAAFSDTLTGAIELCRREGLSIAGLNISGLLYHGGYTQKNMFSLRADYSQAVELIALELLEQNCALVFVPHVFPRSAAYQVESDLEACRKTAACILEKKPEAKIFIADSDYTHNQIKYIIGKCDFFAGSRMHSCIAALSQCIPAVGIAYSGKFKGVFESAGQQSFVIDAKTLTAQEIVERVYDAFINKEKQKTILRTQITSVQKQIKKQFALLTENNFNETPFRRVDQVSAWRLCLGCGACASACPDKNILMKDVTSRGIRPFLRFANCRFCSKCVQVCPGVSLSHYKGLANGFDEWGPILAVWEGYASDPEIRRSGSSGGAATAIAHYCIDNESIAGVLQIKADENEPLKNKAVFSTSYRDLLEGTGSRYSPAAPCERFDYMTAANSKSVFIGKPCDTAGLAKYKDIYPDIREKVLASISIFCAGTPSTQGTIEVLNRMGVESKTVTSFRYRGNGWPGKAVANAPDKQTEMSYDESWGQILSKHVAFRCRICPDSTGEFGDISCGDPWYRPIENGDPGRSLVIARTERGRRLVQKAMQAGYLTLEPADAAIVPLSQKSLLNKRRSIWARLSAMHLFGIPVPDYKGFNLFSSWRRLPFSGRLKSFAGTFRRIIQRKWYLPDEQETSR